MNRLYGVKLYDSQFCRSETVDLLQEAGFNTVYLGRDALVPAFTEELSARGLFWNIVEPVFLASEGEELATLEDGSPASDSWVRFVCPTDPDHLNRVRERIASDIRTFNPPGVSLDFLRFFQFWEMTSPTADPQSLPKSCFCPRCRAQRTLMDWRQNIVEQTALTLCSEIRQAKPEIRIGIHCVPWKRDMYDDAIRNVIGQNFGNLAEIGDYLTPMVYHHMMHQEPEYIREFLADMAGQGVTEILPSIQVRKAYREDEMSAEEFGEALGYALESPSNGVLLYKWEDLVNDSERLDIVRSMLRR